MNTEYCTIISLTAHTMIHPVIQELLYHNRPIITSPLTLAYKSTYPTLALSLIRTFHLSLNQKSTYLNFQIQLNLDTQTIIHRLIRPLLNPRLPNGSGPVSFCSGWNDPSFVNFLQCIRSLFLALGLVLLLLLVDCHLEGC